MPADVASITGVDCPPARQSDDSTNHVWQLLQDPFHPDTVVPAKGATQSAPQNPRFRSSPE